MGCGRDQTIGTQTPSAAVGHDLLLSRPPEERRAIRAEMPVISQPVCTRQGETSCSNFDDYVGAWKRLAASSPFIGYKLLSQNGLEWPDSFSDQAAKRGTSKISQELWQQAIAFRWIFKNIPEDKQFSFLEEVATDSQERHPLVFVNLADYLLPEHNRDAWMNPLESVRTNLRAGGAQVFDEQLGRDVRAELSAEGRRQIFSRPDSPMTAK